MKNREAIEKLERHSKLICLGCMHPSMVGWCENHCQLPEAFKMAISALEKQSRIITVTDAEGGLIASISDKDIIEENGVHVIISEE